MFKTSKGVKRVFKISWWKLAPGVALTAFGLFGMILYLTDINNYLFAGMAVGGLGPGILLIYWVAVNVNVGYMFYTTKRKQTGEENAIVYNARKNSDGKDVPLELMVIKVNNIPHGARLHYVKNFGRHFYELRFNTSTRKLEEAKLTDRAELTPEQFKEHACMQRVKEWMEYTPPTMMQKVAPGLLLAAMGIVAIIKVMIGGE